MHPGSNVSYVTLGYGGVEEVDFFFFFAKQKKKWKIPHWLRGILLIYLLCRLWAFSRAPCGNFWGNGTILKENINFGCI